MGVIVPPRLHVIGSICLVIAIQSGCASLDRRHVPLSLPNTARLVEAREPSIIAPRLQVDPVQPVSTEREPRNVLVLSGGGANGAYTAGVLNGWTASGTRPQFDVVTGISTGALIAPFAFLGPEHDDTLRRLHRVQRERHL
jgi:Patatin-like phospholipase